MDTTDSAVLPVRKAAEKVQVTLMKPHTHKGETLLPGAEIRVTQYQADWLRKEGVIA